MVASTATIEQAQCFHLNNVSIEPPPFRSTPNVADGILLAIRTSDGHVGWGMSHHADVSVADFVNAKVVPLIVGERADRIDCVTALIGASFRLRTLGPLLRGAQSLVDIALWDVAGKRLQAPLHVLFGGRSDRVETYITFGAAYGDSPKYSLGELAAEAQTLVESGHRFLKTVVGRDAVPDAREDYSRMAAVREAVGPGVRLAMDAAGRTFDLRGATELADRCTELDIAFFEEPVAGNAPSDLLRLRRQTRIPIAAAEMPGVELRQLLEAGAVDIFQPNANNDGGYSRARALASAAQALGMRIGHGNGAGPHNVPLFASISGAMPVEYHYHRWKAYNAIFQRVAQPEMGFAVCSEEPGTGLIPNLDIVAAFGGPVKIDLESA